MRVHALSLLCKDEDDKDQRMRVTEVDVKVELPDFSATQLRSALEQYFNSGARIEKQMPKNKFALSEAGTILFKKLNMDFERVQTSRPSAS